MQNMRITDLTGTIEVIMIELRLRFNNVQYAIVTLESGDKFAVRGELEDNQRDLKVTKIEDSILPYYIVFGNQDEYNKTVNHYLTAGVIKESKIVGMEDLALYDILKEYECAIADAIIEYGKLHHPDTVIHFCNYPESTSIEFKIMMTDMKGEIKVREIEMYENSDIFNQYAIVTLESGDRFAVRGQLASNLVNFLVKIECAIQPYDIAFGNKEESNKAYNHYLAAGVVKDLIIKGFENAMFYEMTKEYECAIADAIIEYCNSHHANPVIDFVDYKKPIDPNYHTLF